MTCWKRFAPSSSSPRPSLTSGWGQRRDVIVSDRVAEWGLGKGESAVVALALHLGATAVLDDRSARRCAKALAVPVIGTLGVIGYAKKRGIIEAAAPVMRALLDAGLYYDEAGVRRVLEGIGEPWP